MLVNINDVSKRLKITNRAVQNKCKQYGLVKIGNQYQITNDIAEKWYSEAQETKEQKQNRSAFNYRTSHRSDKSTSLLLYGILIVILLVALYYNQYIEIKETKEELYKKQVELQKEQIEHKTDVKELRKIVDSQKDTISKKEIELQNFKKDNLRLFKRW